MGYDEASFSDDVIARWGMLSEELIEDAGLLHPQMATLGHLFVEFPNARTDILAFLSEVLSKRNSISEIENAVAISFIEWPELRALSDQQNVPSNVIDVVRTRWERFGAVE